MSPTSVYTGIWTDWSHGRAAGLTLTLTQKHSGYLLSFLAILVTFAGAQLWKIAAFILHNLGSGKPLQRHRLIHQQQQVILRNSHEAGSTILDLFRLMWAWKNQGVRHSRTYVSIVLASLILVGFSVAGIFTGEITKSASKHMLVESNICGTWQATGDATSYATTAIYAQKKVNDTLSAANYVANCYDNTLNSSLEFCSPLVFGERFCRAENDTLSGLGAVDEFVRCYTGPTVYTNYTFSVDTHLYFVGTSGYQLQAYYAENNVMYANPMDDPFFSAHRARYVPFGTNRDALANVTMYAFDSWIDAMGCTDQHQICNSLPLNSSNKVCTPLTALLGVEEAILANGTDEKSAHLAMNPYQLSTAVRVFEAVDGWAIFDVVNARGATAMKANDVLVGLSSPGLPIDQWAVETRTWFAQTLAAVQSAIIQYTTGPGTTEGQIVPPANKYDAKGCKSQLIHNSGAYQNFSVLGIAIVVALSGIIILFSFLLHPLTNLLLCRESARQWHRPVWVMEDKLQLQRLAYQGAGHRQGWHRVHESVPVSDKDQLFDDMTAVEDRAPLRH
ncbi:hypothetical protein LTS17_012595 [Exophiala oligosperma]